MEEVRKGKFEWKIYNFMRRRNVFKESEKFKLSSSDCWLHIDCNVDHCVKCSTSYEIFLYNFELQNSSYKIFCKFCLIDGRGNEYLVTERITLQSEHYYIPLMSIGYKELTCHENYLLPNDVLTLRLSWYEEEDNVIRKEDIRMTSNLKSDKEKAKLQDTLSNDFIRIFESKKGTDCVLTVGDAQLPVHRAVLSARSQVFEAMFNHDTTENRSGEVDVLDVNASVLSDVLYYVYSGHIRGLSADTAAHMYIVADRYALIELRDVCLDFLKRSLTIENICDAALVSEIHGETDLEKKVVQFLKIKLLEVEGTNQWKEILESKPLLAVKLLRSALLVDKIKK